MRVFIISQPKAGTYLAANILRNLGLKHTGLHLQPNGEAHMYLMTPGKDRWKRVYYRNKNLQEAANRCPNNAFVVGHIHYSITAERQLSKFKKVLVTRALADYEGAMNRYRRIRPGKENLKNPERTYKQIGEWRHHNVFHLKFEHMRPGVPKRIDQLQEFLFDDVIYDSRDIIRKSLEQESLTKT